MLRRSERTTEVAWRTRTRTPRNSRPRKRCRNGGKRSGPSQWLDAGGWQPAAAAAEEAARAAVDTAEAAKAALASAKLAEASAAATARAAKVIVQSTRSDLADAETDVAQAEVGEAAAHQRYRDASDRATRRGESPS